MQVADCVRAVWGKAVVREFRPIEQGSGAVPEDKRVIEEMAGVGAFLECGQTVAPEQRPFRHRVAKGVPLLGAFLGEVLLVSS